MFFMSLHSAVIYSLCYTSLCIALLQCALRKTPCTSSGTTGLPVKQKLKAAMVPMLWRCVTVSCVYVSVKRSNQSFLIS